MIGMYVQSLLRLNLIVLFLLLIRRLIGSRVRKKFIYGLWIVIPVFLLSFPFVKLPQLFHLNLHWNPHYGQLLQMKENNGLPKETADEVALQQKTADDPGRKDVVKVEALNGNAVNGNAIYESVGNEDIEKGNSGNGKELSYLKKKENSQAGFVEEQTQTKVAGDIQKHEQKINIQAVVVILYLSIVIGIMFTIFTANFLFMNSCKKKRKYLFRSKAAGLPVYHMDGISSPFLMGKTIYLPSFMTEEEQIRYAVLHEECHYRHGDAFWVIIRYAIVAIYFYDPIIWWAFFTSGYDCELACDEEVLEKIGTEERKSYGACLLEIVEQNQSKNNRMVLTTNMSTGKKFIRKRILSIMDRKKKSRFTMILAAVLLLLVTGCVYEKQSEDAANLENPTSQIEEVKEETSNDQEQEGMVAAGDDEGLSNQTEEISSGNNEESIGVMDSEPFEPYTIKAGEITTEELIAIANYLRTFAGEFGSISEISPNYLIAALLDAVDCRVSRDQELLALFDDGNRYLDHVLVYEFDEEQVKKVAKDVFDIDLTNYLESIKTENTIESPKGPASPIKHKDGKFYELYQPADGDSVTVKNVTKKNDTYTYYISEGLDSESRDLAVCTKHEVVIQNGVIKSVKDYEGPTEEDLEAYLEVLEDGTTIDEKEMRRVYIAYLLMEKNGGFNSLSSLSEEALLSAAIYGTEQHKIADSDVKALYENDQKSDCFFCECDEQKVKQTVKECLNLSLTQQSGIDKNIKYQDGKYVIRYNPETRFFDDDKDIYWQEDDGSIIEINGYRVRKNGDTYTIFTTSTIRAYGHLNILFNGSFVEEHQYEVVIKDGVIVSGKQIY